MSDPSASFACRNLSQVDLTRRRLISAGGLGLLGLTMPRWLAAKEKSNPAPKVRAKRVIFLFQWGGPSQLDTFDMKPDAPDDIRGPLKPIQSSLTGIPVCEHFPQMAKRMHEVTLIRTMTHTMQNHNSAGYYALSGHAPPTDDQRLRDSLETYPAFGSIVDHLSPAISEMPTSVAYPHVIRDGSITPGQTASFLGKAHDPLFFTRKPDAKDFSLPELSLPSGLSFDRIRSRRELQKLVDRQSRLMDISGKARGMDNYYEKALAMLSTPKVRRAFDIGAEPSRLRDAYGRTTYGQSCLLARRLVESGVKFVTVYFSNTIGGQSIGSGGWDTHGNNGHEMYKIVNKYHHPMADQTLSVLLDDLKQRGLLEDTLVLWMGEFGRTPKINSKKSRDHWPRCYTILMAGGGVKSGFVYGASDKNAAMPARDPVRPEDLAATLFYLMGIDPQTTVRDTLNRPLTIASGSPVMDVIA